MVLSIEQEDVGAYTHTLTNSDIGRGHIHLDMYKSKINSNN